MFIIIIWICSLVIAFLKHLEREQFNTENTVISFHILINYIHNICHASQTIMFLFLSFVLIHTIQLEHEAIRT